MIHVFAGPTIGPDEQLLTGPAIRLLPPVRHGDLFDRGIGDDDTVVIIDGLYHQAPALRHKEILAVLGRGVRVIGAASIGALRAAELADFGMLGVGEVFRAFAGGELDGDDEVAVGQAPDGEQRSLTWPLVNLRYAMALGESAGLLNRGHTDALLTGFCGVYYPHRTFAAVLAVCRRLGAGEFECWLRTQRGLDRHFANLKRADALEAVQVALAGRPLPAVPRRSAAWGTAYFQRWVNHFEAGEVDGVPLVTAHRVAYQQIFDPGFRLVWLSYLDRLSRRPGSRGAGMPLSERLARLPGVPAHVLFHPPVDLADPAGVAELLAGETAADRAAVARYARCNEEAAREHPTFMAEAISDGVALRTLLATWRVDERCFADEAAARGFRNGAHAVEEMKRFVVGLLRDRERVTTPAGADR